MYIVQKSLFIDILINGSADQLQEWFVINIFQTEFYTSVVVVVTCRLFPGTKPVVTVSRHWAVLSSQESRETTSMLLAFLYTRFQSNS